MRCDIFVTQLNGLVSTVSPIKATITRTERPSEQLLKWEPFPGLPIAETLPQSCAFILMMLASPLPVADQKLVI
jgi:hypothetical protein